MHLFHKVLLSEFMEKDSTILKLNKNEMKNQY